MDKFLQEDLNQHVFSIPVKLDNQKIYIQTVLCYFPYKEGFVACKLNPTPSFLGQETVPILPNKRDNDSGLLVYWNFRGIPEAAIPR